MRKLLTICIIQDGERVLLGLKKRGFGAGHWNGFGGKVEAGETIAAAAKREVREEAGVDVLGMTEVGTLVFTFESEPTIREVHVFCVNKFAGEPGETEEMKPMWFAADQVPIERMWPADQYWLPLMLNGKHFQGSFHYDRPTSPDYTAKILRHTLVEVDPLK